MVVKRKRMEINISSKSRSGYGMKSNNRTAAHLHDHDEMRTSKIITRRQILRHCKYGKTTTMIISSYLLYILTITIITSVVYGYITPYAYTDENIKCIGLEADFTKVEEINTTYLEKIQNPTGNRNFEIMNINRITRGDNTGDILKDRVRLVERIDGIRIRGADVVVAFVGDCNDGAIVCSRQVESLTGKTFRTINVRDGYTTNITESDVKQHIANLFNTDEDGIGTLSLEVYAATNGDHLAYFTDVLVENDSYMRYMNVIIDAHTLAILSVCNLVEQEITQPDQQQPELEREKHKEEREKEKQERKKQNPPRYLRDDNIDHAADDADNNYYAPPVSVNGINCGNCAYDTREVVWSNSNYSTCPINSLYLNNDGRESICVVGTADDGEAVLGAGPIPELHWNGTLDCKSTIDQCGTSILPECSDALSDVHYAATKTLQYFQQYLGVMGGLQENPDDPIPIRAKVHYNRAYCNAFYRASENTVFFGDCDCNFWTPLTSVDIVAHEIAHGVTKHTSGLEYQYQSGGMNEGFSDIVGTVVEFLLDDSTDTPDFDIGEMLGNKLRSMENPREVFSIDSVCDYESFYQVHHTSGPLNKAYVNAVRACESNGCSDLKGCTTLIGTIFMYANIQSLTTYSTYLDGATATCDIVNEYYEAKIPSTTCEQDYITKFIRQGWTTANIFLDENCQASTCCDSPCPTIPPSPQGPTPNPTEGPPTTLMPTPAPSIFSPAPSPPPSSATSASSPSPPPSPPLTTEQTDEESDESENIILRIYKMLVELFNFFSSFRDALT